MSQLQWLKLQNLFHVSFPRIQLKDNPKDIFRAPPWGDPLSLGHFYWQWNYCDGQKVLSVIGFIVQCGSQWKWKMCPSLKTKRIFPPNEFFGQSDSLACMYLVAVYLARVEMPSIPSGWFLMDSPWGMRECLKEIQGLCKPCLISPSFYAVQALGREWAWSRDGTGWCFRLLERFVLWLCWTCSAACGLSLAAVSRASSLVPGCGLPVGVTALVAVHGLEVCRCL